MNEVRTLRWHRPFPLVHVRVCAGALRGPRGMDTEQTDGRSGASNQTPNRRAEMGNRATLLTKVVFVLENKLHWSWTVLHTNR